ncbi:hypothetical protein LR48_Vigan05g088400 [Vigna angularis]|uniref:Uncharacterized protein n=1 Tax=Phaseolus angularis TaxID=3914 RepID=A0A0L9UK57_PHAAN|nr:hypothetical protein LR48_Vigan05g088400 [Vigna angularis]
MKEKKSELLETYHSRTVARGGVVVKCMSFPEPNSLLKSAPNELRKPCWKPPPNRMWTHIPNDCIVLAEPVEPLRTERTDAVFRGTHQHCWKHILGLQEGVHVNGVV